ncbi:MAG TPA: alanyl-tRNA editing protein, partial [Thermoleophilia bacterium]|nr:alanyl-tRNA editing protein [Thermoleophilia bacterium]
KQKLYLQDSYRSEFEARVDAAAPGRVALSATAFFPGGGGQPPDVGELEIAGVWYRVTGICPDGEGRVWHVIEGAAGRGGAGRAAVPAAAGPGGPVAAAVPDAPPEDAGLFGGVPSVGAVARGRIDWPRRHAFMRHHTLLHIVNSVVLADHGGLITGVQIAEDKSRIDFKLDGLDSELVAALEARVNGVITRDLVVSAGLVTEAEFRLRPELVRTAGVEPPVVDGWVRVVSIEGFDAQACGGTHVRRTGEIGACTVLRTENKGKNNKRLYLAVQDPCTG